MTSDEEKDPPVPSYLEGVSLNRVDDDRATKEHDTTGTESSPSNDPDV